MNAAASTRSVSRRLRSCRRWRVRVAVLLVLFSPALYSYVATLAEPSSLPLAVRSVEWVRSHHGGWLVDETEHVYYGWLKAPRTGGPSLAKLPSVGLPPTAPTPVAGAAPGVSATTPATPAAQVGQSPPVSGLPAAVQPVISPALPNEGIWQPTGPDVAGGPRARYGVSAGGRISADGGLRRLVRSHPHPARLLPAATSRRGQPYADQRRCR